MIDDWPVLPAGVEGVLVFRLPPHYEAEQGTCADCGRDIAPDENVLADERGIHCGNCA